MRDRILDAVECLRGRYGYQKTTMDDVAREAGIAKRTIYLHFPTKEEVFLASIDRIVDRLQQSLQEIASTSAPAGQRLRNMLVHRVLFRFDSVRDYSHTLDELLGSLRLAYLERRKQYFQAEAQIFAKVLSEGRRQGAFTVSDVLATAHTLLVATNSLLPSNLTPRELGSRDEVRRQADLVADLLLNGLRRRDKQQPPG